MLTLTGRGRLIKRLNCIRFSSSQVHLANMLMPWEVVGNYRVKHGKRQDQTAQISFLIEEVLTNLLEERIVMKWVSGFTLQRCSCTCDSKVAREIPRDCLHDNYLLLELTVITIISTMKSAQN